MEIHVAVVDADHAHPVGAVTENVLEPPADVIERLAGATVKEHGTPDWVTVTDWPAIVSVPLRCVAIVFAATEIVTVPFAVPLAPVVIVIHGEEDAAVQAQPIGAVTENVFEPPDDPNDRLVGVTAYVQGT